jgi:hypothetical protein
MQRSYQRVAMWHLCQNPPSGSQILIGRGAKDGLELNVEFVGRKFPLPTSLFEDVVPLAWVSLHARDQASHRERILPR